MKIDLEWMARVMGYLLCNLRRSVVKGYAGITLRGVYGSAEGGPIAADWCDDIGR